MPAQHFEGFAPQFAAVQVIKPTSALASDIHQGNVDVRTYSDLKPVSLPALDRVSKDRVQNTSSVDRHYLVATRGVMSAFLPVHDNSKDKNLRRLCQHTAAEKTKSTDNPAGVDCAWFQVQVTATAPK